MPSAQRGDRASELRGLISESSDERNDLRIGLGVLDSPPSAASALEAFLSSRTDHRAAMSEESPDRLGRLAAYAGLLFAGSLMLGLTALALGSTATFEAAAAFGVVVVAILAITAIWAAWRFFSWLSLFLVAAPFVAYLLSVRLNTTGSGLSWLGTYFALTATVCLGVGLTSRSPSVLARAVALSVAFASLFAFFFVVLLLLVWDGDLN